MERDHYGKSVFTSLQIADALLPNVSPHFREVLQEEGEDRDGEIGGGSVGRSEEREIGRKYQKYPPPFIQGRQKQFLAMDLWISDPNLCSPPIPKMYKGMISSNMAAISWRRRVHKTGRKKSVRHRP